MRCLRHEELEVWRKIDHWKGGYKNPIGRNVWKVCILSEGYNNDTYCFTPLLRAYSKQIFLQKESDFHTVDGHNTGILSWGYFLKSHLTLQDNDFDSLLFQVNTLPETNVAPEKKIFVEDGRLLAFFQFHLFRCYINVNVPIITSPPPRFFFGFGQKRGGF